MRAAKDLLSEHFFAHTAPPFTTNSPVSRGADSRFFQQLVAGGGRPIKAYLSRGACRPGITGNVRHRGRAIVDIAHIQSTHTPAEAETWHMPSGHSMSDGMLSDLRSVRNVMSEAGMEPINPILISVIYPGCDIKDLR